MTTTIGPAALKDQVSVPASCHPDVVLGAYPPIARCPSCRRYILDWAESRPGLHLVTAALAYHESSHAFDPLTAASQHFADPA